MPAAFDVSRLATVQLVPPTPFTADGQQVRPDVLAGFVKSMAAAGMRVFLPAAGTGEFHSLSADEVVACVQATRNAVDSSCTVIAPVGLSVAHAVTIARRAAEVGADALLVMPPVHPYVSDAGFRDYFNAIAQATPLPLLAYKKGPAPSDALLSELGQAGRLIGVKYAVNDVDAFARFADANRHRLSLSCGTAERFAPFFLLAGAVGYTSGAGSLCPRVTLAMHRAMATGNHAEAWRLLRIVRPIEDYRARDGDSFNISLIKFGLQECGHDFGPVRPPQRQLTSEQQADIRCLLEPILTAEAALAKG